MTAEFKAVPEHLDKAGTDSGTSGPVVGPFWRLVQPELQDLPRMAVGRGLAGGRGEVG